MLAAGGRALAGHPRLVAALYAAQLAFAGAMMLAVFATLSALYAEHRLFDRGVAGDLVSLAQALRSHKDVLLALAWLGVAIAFLYSVVSWALTAGLLGVLATPLQNPEGLSGASRFGAVAAARLGAFGRLWAWSLIPYGVAILAVAAGGSAAAHTEEALSFGQLIAPPLLGALPGLLLLALTACAVDYGRVLLICEPTRRQAGRALLDAFRFCITSPRPLLHYGLYVGLWAAVTALYVGITLGRPFTGTGGALLLFLIRQIVAAARLSARIATYAGQVVLVCPADHQDSANGRNVPG